MSIISISSIIGGGLNLGIGGVLLLSTSHECGDCSDEDDAYNDEYDSTPLTSSERRRVNIGIGFVVTGLSIVGGGVVLKMIGSAKIKNGKYYHQKFEYYDSLKKKADIRFVPTYNFETRAYGGMVAFEF